MAEVDLIIAGRPYRVACRDGEEESLRAAARLVDSKSREALAGLGTLSEARQLLFAGLLLADQLIDQMKEAKLKVSRATVYRTLNKLVDAGLLREMQIGAKKCYEHDYGYPEHEHMKCSRCQKMFEFESSDLDAQAGVASITLYTIIHYSVFILIGMVAARFFDLLDARPGILVGTVLGFLLFDLIFYAGVIISGSAITAQLGVMRVTEEIEPDEKSGGVIIKSFNPDY